MNRTELRKSRKRKRLRNLLIGFLIFLFAIGGFSIYYIINTYLALEESYTELEREKSEYREMPVELGRDSFSVLLLGIEDYASGGKNGRTDVIMVVTFNPEDKSAKLVSIPRDTLVELYPDKKLGKINAAHVFGGKEGVIETVEKFLEIPIDYFAAVDFDGFINIIDILGGVEVEVPFNFTQHSVEGKVYHFQKGRMKLDGDAALQYVRMRHQDPAGDIGRNARQQEVIKAIVDKVVSLGTITKIHDIAREVGQHVETNFKISQFPKLLNQFSGFSTANIEQLKIETYSERYNKSSVQIPEPESLAEVKNILKQHLGLQDNAASQDVVDDKN